MLSRGGWLSLAVGLRHMRRTTLLEAKFKHETVLTPACSVSPFRHLFFGNGDKRVYAVGINTFVAVPERVKVAGQ
jgi:hypothetical protein